MDYKGFLSHFSRVACVMSVNLREEGDKRYLVEDANDAYKRTVVKSLEDFETHVPYTQLLHKSSKFAALGI